MSWRDQLAAQSVGGRALMGQFRDATFIVPESTANVGRRVDVHEYPLRDTPWSEDIGRAARHFELDVFVDESLGDYRSARDALIKALETPGPGQLVHPWYGQMSVVLAQPASVRESSRRGGRATFRLQFVEAGELLFPAADNDTQTQVQQQANRSIAAVTTTFIANYDTSGLPDWSLAELQKRLQQSLTKLALVVGNISESMTSQVRAPANMAAGIIGSIQQLQQQVPEPSKALRVYQTMFGGADLPTVQNPTTVRRKQVTAAFAQRQLVQQTLVVEACRTASSVDYVSRDDALTTLAQLVDALDDQAATTHPVTGAPIDDAVFRELRGLRAAITKDLRQRGAKLPQVVTFESIATQPCLVLAWRLYADPGREPELLARNAIRWPGFVSAGTPLEVLNA